MLLVIGQEKLGCSIEILRDIIYIYVGLYVCRESKCIAGITWPKHAHAQSQFWAVKPTCDTIVIHFDYTQSSFTMD